MAELVFPTEDNEEMARWRWAILEANPPAEVLSLTYLHVPADAPQEDHDRADALLRIIQPAIQEAAEHGWYFETRYRMMMPIGKGDE